uniref:Uncharacterized protein n=1 Tax=Marseillevirus LCMAC103 TaxID=2506604 RepID=A0A481YUW4_9VIRU|nr:MAG: hypothetical protein LCMAC103_00160 [Marseillevirus LCMAC103]
MKLENHYVCLAVILALVVGAVCLAPPLRDRFHRGARVKAKARAAAKRGAAKARRFRRGARGSKFFDVVGYECEDGVCNPTRGGSLSRRRCIQCCGNAADPCP